MALYKSISNVQQNVFNSPAAVAVLQLHLHSCDVVLLLCNCCCCCCCLAAGCWYEMSPRLAGIWIVSLFVDFFRRGRSLLVLRRIADDDDVRRSRSIDANLRHVIAVDVDVDVDGASTSAGREPRARRSERRNERWRRRLRGRRHVQHDRISRQRTLMMTISSGRRCGRRWSSFDLSRQADVHHQNVLVVFVLLLLLLLLGAVAFTTGGLAVRKRFIAAAQLQQKSISTNNSLGIHLIWLLIGNLKKKMHLLRQFRHVDRFDLLESR